MKKILKCSMIIIGTLIGAGFASGKEIVIFFNYFLEKGILGMILSSFLFGVVIYEIINIVNQMDLANYIDLVNKNRFFTIIIKAFTFICFCIMLSGIGTFVNEQHNVNFWIGTIGTGLICFLSFLFKFNGLEKINKYLVPLILVGIITLSFTSKANIENTTMDITNFHQAGLLTNWVQSSILYFGYNSILLVPILLEMRQYRFHKKEISILSIFVSLLLCTIGLIVYFTLKKYSIEIIYAEMPMLFIAKQTDKIIFYCYSLVIIFAIFTTAFSSGYAILKLNQDKNYFKNCILICVLGVVFARIGFSNLVNWCFPIFGYFGVLQMVYILLINKKNL